MIDEALLKTILLEKPKYERYVERDIKLVNIDKIYSIIGPRRAGKTYFLFQIIDKLIKQGANSSQIIYINFEDDRLSSIEKEDLQKIIDTYYNLFPENKKKIVYFMFDEIQNVPMWSKFVRRLYDKEKCRIFITGSSAKLLSREIATELRGRTWTYKIYPFSFKEYISANEITFEKNMLYSEDRHKMIKMFEQYLICGGFPESLKVDKTQRIILLQNYFETVMFRDVIDRNKLTNIDVVREIFKSLAENFARLFSVNKFYNTLKSMNRSASKDYIYPLLKYLEDTMYFFFVEKYSESHNVKLVSPKKVYLIDNGLVNSLISKKEEEGWFYENLAAIELFRRNNEVHYYSDKNECDFIALNPLNKEKTAIQVTLNPSEEREIKGLLEALDRINSKRGIIITKSEEKVIHSGKKEIKIIPLWKWLLSEDLP